MGDEAKFKKMEDELTRKQVQKLSARQAQANEGNEYIVLGIDQVD